ncbi:MAG: outer membrane beta-barrel protein [Bacteroides sp.]|nr:outer membrane beta-barrel protein [Bacteroides sp.]
MKHLFIILTAFCPSVIHAITVAPDTTTVKNHQLDEVVVKAEKPQIKASGSTLTVDLPAIVRDKPVSNLLEALPYLPGITRQDDQFILAGAEGITILINGEVQTMPVETLYQLLRSIPVERLKNAEIMYATPAKYHVKGASVNLVLKTPSILDGLQGQLQGGYENSHYSSYTAGASALYATGRFTFNLNYNLSDNKNWNHEDFISRHTIEGITHDISEQNRRTSSSLKNLLHSGITYKLPRNATLQLVYNTHITGNIHSVNHTTGNLGDFTNKGSNEHPSQFHDISAAYKSDSWEFHLDFTHYNQTSHQQLYDHNLDETTVDAINRQRINRWHLYIDRTRKFGNWEFNYGADYRYANDRSRQGYTIPDRDGFNTKINEHTANIYVGTETRFDCGLSLTASVAGEYYNYDHQHNWNLIPQFGMTYYRTPKSIFQLNFTSDRVYPSYWDVHGGQSYLDSYSIVMGNPTLRPYINYGGQLNYILRQKYVATLFCNYKDGYSVQLPYQKPDELQLIFQTVNFDYNYKIGFNIHIPFSAGNTLNSTFTLQGFLNHVKSRHFHDISFDRKKFITFMSLSNTVRFSDKLPFFLTVDAACLTSSLQGPADMSELWRIDAGLKWTFPRRDAELTLKCDDIFNSWSPTMTIRHLTQDYRMKIHDMSRSFSLTLTWRFNGFKPKDSTIDIDTSRFGTGK